MDYNKTRRRSRSAEEGSSALESQVRSSPTLKLKQSPSVVEYERAVINRATRPTSSHHN
jgi:hypothetical protein